MSRLHYTLIDPIMGESLCTISYIAEIVFNIYEFITVYALSKTDDFNVPCTTSLEDKTNELIEFIKKTEINVVNKYGLFSYNIELIKSFNSIIKPFIIEGQINNVPKLNDHQVCINHALLLIDIISPKSIKWHAHDNEYQFCWCFEPDSITFNSSFTENDLIKFDINFIITLYSCIIQKKHWKIADITNIKEIIYTVSSLLTWSFTSLYENYVSDDLKLFQSNNYKFKVDIYGNIVNISKDCSIILPICNAYPQKTSINPNWQYHRYIFYNIYNNKIFFNEISNNISNLSIRIITNLFDNNQTIKDNDYIPILLRLIHSSSSVKLFCYQFLIKYIELREEISDKYINLIIKGLDNYFPISESQLSLLQPFIDCYITLLNSARRDKIVYNGISSVFDNLWNLRSNPNVSNKILNIYMSMVDYWIIPSFLHFEKIISVAFSLIEPEYQKSLLYNNISYSLDAIDKLLNIYKNDMKYYCFDIFYRLYNLYFTIKYEYNNIVMDYEVDKVNLTILHNELFEKIKQIVKLCNNYFTINYCKKCVDQLKSQLCKNDKLFDIIDSCLYN